VSPLAATAVAIAGFLLGSVPFGVLVARRRGVDVRAAGSKNIGATNVARTVSRRAGIVVLLFDVAKGAVPVAVYLHALPAPENPLWLVAAGLAPILGHCFSPWLRLRGGKGVATALGVFAVVDPVAAGAAIASFAIVFALLRVVSLGSILGSLTIVTLQVILDRPEAQIILAAAAAALIIARHHANLRRLLTRRELDV
jgi:glycerol-3-phosphate acyltransferase PlsY